MNRCAKALYFDESKLDTHWAYPAISFALEQGFMSKNQYGEFTPNFPLTRGMFVTALGRLAGGTAEEVVPSGFTDIPIDHYAAPYVTWAKETGIMNGVSADTFGVNSPLTRQQMAAALARYARYQGAQPGAFDLNTYSDSASIAAWAREDVADCSALGLLNGSDGAFRPEETTTRAMGRPSSSAWPATPGPRFPQTPMCRRTRMCPPIPTYLLFRKLPRTRTRPAAKHLMANNQNAPGIPEMGCGAFFRMWWGSVLIPRGESPGSARAWRPLALGWRVPWE